MLNLPASRPRKGVAVSRSCVLKPTCSIKIHGWDSDRTRTSRVMSVEVEIAA